MPNSSSPTPKNYLQYWRPAQVNGARADTAIGHSSSEQLGKVIAGDTLWIVTLFDGALTLCARLKVEWRGPREDAQAKLNTDDVWEAAHHVIANEDIQPIRDVDLSDIASLLRFRSSSNRDRLNVTDGRVDGKQLQSMRELTPESVDLLQQRWNEGLVDAVVQQNISAGAGFGDPKVNKAVETAAVNYVTSWYRSRKWRVVSVEARKCGFDLICTKGIITQNVEVKGVQGSEPSFFITQGELKQAEENPQFHICVVVSALSDSPQLIQLTGAEFLETYQTVALVHRASPLNSLQAAPVA